eukprot:SAG31_NODE_6244_length_2104_cov_2.144140_1_plen_194_part_10
MTYWGDCYDWRGVRAAGLLEIVIPGWEVFRRGPRGLKLSRFWATKPALSLLANGVSYRAMPWRCADRWAFRSIKMLGSAHHFAISSSPLSRAGCRSYSGSGLSTVSKSNNLSNACPVATLTAPCVSPNMICACKYSSHEVSVLILAGGWRATAWCVGERLRAVGRAHRGGPRAPLIASGGWPKACVRPIWWQGS